MAQDDPTRYALIEEEKTTFATGASRSKLDDVRYDLVSHVGLRHLAARYALGAVNHGDNNWRNGMPYSAIVNHMQNHLQLYLSGDRSDDHMAAVAWGAFAILESDELRPENNDLHFGGKKSSECMDTGACLGSNPACEVTCKLEGGPSPVALSWPPKNLR